MKKFIEGVLLTGLVFLIYVLSSVFIKIPNINNTSMQVHGIKTTEALITNIEVDKAQSSLTDGSGMTIETKIVTAKILKGQHKGKSLTLEDSSFNGMQSPEEMKKGLKIKVSYEEDQNGNITNPFLNGISRDKYVIYMAISFALILIIVGGSKGFRSVITLSLTFVAIIKIMFPLIMKGYNPVVIAILISIGMTISTLAIANGFSKKTLNAIIGTVCGVLVAGFIAFIFNKFIHVTGLGNEEAQMLMMISKDIHFNYKGILFAGIIIGAVGAVMDVAMSISSAVKEIEFANPNLSSKELIKSGMNIGHDIIGTMSDTLILAYAGGSMNLILLFLFYNIPASDILNMDIVASEVLKAISGSIGLAVSIPITAVVSATIGRERTYKNIVEESNMVEEDAEVVDTIIIPKDFYKR